MIRRRICKALLLPIAATALVAATPPPPPPTPTASPEAPPMLSDAALRARYTLPGSRFMDIDGEPIHYVDEGKGDAIVLIHGTFASLRQWNGWAQALTRQYRVIRFDRPPAGLSGPDPKGIYDIDRELHLIDELTRRLGAQRFFLVATSSGGISGAAYAAEHPERVKGLILNNIDVGVAQLDMSQLSEDFKRALADDRGRGGYHVPEFWRQILLHNYYDKSKVTPALVREWAELNNRAPRMPPTPGQVGMGAARARTPGDLARITIPTLVIWSADDMDTPLATVGQKAMPLLAARDKQFAVIPHCGHMMPLECGDEGLAIARPFFDRVAAAQREVGTRP